MDLPPTTHNKRHWNSPTTFFFFSSFYSREKKESLYQNKKPKIWMKNFCIFQSIFFSSFWNIPKGLRWGPIKRMNSNAYNTHTPKGRGGWGNHGPHAAAGFDSSLVSNSHQFNLKEKSSSSHTSRLTYTHKRETLKWGKRERKKSEWKPFGPVGTSVIDWMYSPCKKMSNAVHIIHTLLLSECA